MKNAIERIAHLARKRIYALRNDDDWESKRNSRYANCESECGRRQLEFDMQKNIISFLVDRHRSIRRFYIEQNQHSG